MPEMPNIPISELTTTSVVTGNDLYETAIPDGGTWLSRKVTLDQISNFAVVGNGYNSLNTTSKSIIGAINELVGEEITGTLLAGEETITLASTTLSDGCEIIPSTSVYGINPKSIVPNVSNKTITLTFRQQAEDLGVKVVVI